MFAREGLLADIDLRVTRSNADLLMNRRQIEIHRGSSRTSVTVSGLRFVTPAFWPRQHWLQGMT